MLTATMSTMNMNVVVNPVNAVSSGARRGTRVIRNSLRSSGAALGRVTGFGGREHRLDEDPHEDDDDDGSSAAAMSSSSEADDADDVDNTTGSTRRNAAVSSSMLRLNKSGRKAVQWSKFTIILVLLIIAAAIVAMTYLMLETENYNDFVNGFENAALEMLNRVAVQASNIQTTFHSLATAVTGYANQSMTQWPYLTMPNWQVRALNTFPLTNALALGFSPFVAASNRSSWEDYSVQNADRWMQEALRYQAQLFQLVSRGLDNTAAVDGVYPEVPGSGMENTGITDYVYHIDGNGRKVPLPEGWKNSLLPIWQLAPAPLHNASLVNFDLFNHSVIAPAIQQVIQTKQPALTAAFPNIDALWKGSIANTFFTNSYQQQQQQPMSLFLTPLFEDTKRKDNLVGILYAAVPWSTYLERTVANQNIRGIDVVMDWVPAKPCAGLTTPQPNDSEIYPSFTYRVDGKNASFIGLGDLHEEQYDDMVLTADFIVPVVRGQLPNLTCAFGHYQWLVYPSQELYETSYHPSNAKSWFYAFSVMIVFCIATVIFLSYDYLVQMRQKAVLDTAMRSNAIVTNLFPINVRDRIMQEAEEQAEAEYQQKRAERKRRRRLRRLNKKDREKEEQEAASRPANFGMVPKNQLKDFLSEGQGGKIQRRKSEGGGDYDDDEEREANSKPIADLFPAATVLFADIVGFTAWSSVREPTQVFQLLETLYHHFDEIAHRRKVFKVETIGDCYVAVTGLPDPRPDHAIVMARFAKDILLKSKSLCQRLEVILGPDTGDLCLRIGLHSGAVTAGVLRGEKSRFQLFGDTVNTAARMESNGAPNKIHMSQDTAKLLQAAGKKWTKKRPDLVEAKGKGKMQTYWLATGQAAGEVISNDHRSITRHDMRDSANQAFRSRRNLGMAQSIMNGNKRSQLNVLKGISSQREGLSAEVPPRRGSSVTFSSGDPENRRPGSDDLRGSMHNSKKFVGSVSSKKTARLVRWNAEVLSRLLKQIVARRNAVTALGRSESEPGSPGSDGIASGRLVVKDHNGDGSTDETKPDDSSQMDSSDSDDEFGSEMKRTVLEEVQEIIHLPTFDAEAARNQDDPYSITLGEVVKDQLLAFVTEVASMYRYNPFHNFEHASHVTMSVVKLLSRIVAPDAVVDRPAFSSDEAELVKSLHDHTYGITSDPLTQFAVVLSALIHDLDHPGVPNATLVKEKTSLAALYKNKSIAEQNSVDLAWEVLMGEDYKELRNTVCPTKLETKRLRQLIVNAVMATDIVDQELKKLRNERWDKAFKLGDSAGHVDENPRDEQNRKATIVIEHLIQASDIAHTMQHWHIYRKWNERFFEEMYIAYLEGRAETDPTTFWYQGEIGFFDFYIIPLAKKLKDCGVFGVSSDEYLNYAERNRKEWEIRGKEVVQEYIEKYGSKEDEELNNYIEDLQKAESDSDSEEEPNEAINAPAVEEAPSS